MAPKSSRIGGERWWDERSVPVKITRACKLNFKSNNENQPIAFPAQTVTEQRYAKKKPTQCIMQLPKLDPIIIYGEACLYVHRTLKQQQWFSKRQRCPSRKTTSSSQQQFPRSFLAETILHVSQLENVGKQKAVVDYDATTDQMHQRTHQEARKLKSIQNRRSWDLKTSSHSNKSIKQLWI